MAGRQVASSASFRNLKVSGALSSGSTTVDSVSVSEDITILTGGQITFEDTGDSISTVSYD